MQRKQNSSSLSLEPHFRALCSLMMGSVIILLACFALCGRTCHLDFPSWFCWHPALESVLLRVLQREIRWLIWLCFTGNTHLQGRTSTLLFYSSYSIKTLDFFFHSRMYHDLISVLKYSFGYAWGMDLMGLWIKAVQAS